MKKLFAALALMLLANVGHAELSSFCMNEIDKRYAERQDFMRKWINGEIPEDAVAFGLDGRDDLAEIAAYSCAEEEKSRWQGWSGMFFSKEQINEWAEQVYREALHLYNYKNGLN